VRAALAQIEPDTPVAEVSTMDQIVAQSMARPRTETWLMAVFAMIALALAGLGNYGVMSYAVAQSTHNLGVRVALGATSKDILKLVLRKSALLICSGLVLGLGGAYVITRVLSSLLFGVKPDDPWTFGAVSLLLALIALLAAYFPARRATRIDPVIALRSE
jgi:putative ABC transport system permease protein